MFLLVVVSLLLCVYSQDIDNPDLPCDAVLPDAAVFHEVLFSDVEPTFNYNLSDRVNGPWAWKGYCNNGSLEQQSPIDWSYLETYSSMPFLSFTNYGPLNNVTMTNKGYTLQISLESQTPRWVVSGGMLTNAFKNYQATQLHMHFPSEHTIHGAKQMMEWHIVHDSGQEGRDRFAVVAIMFVPCSNEAGKPELDSVFKPMMDLGSYGSSATVSSLNLFGSEILSSTDLFWSYYGSLTTPDCVPQVVWHVMRRQVCISTNQAAWLQAASPFKSFGDARPVQSRVAAAIDRPYTTNQPGTSFLILDRRNTCVTTALRMQGNGNLDCGQFVFELHPACVSGALISAAGAGILQMDANGELLWRFPCANCALVDIQSYCFRVRSSGYNNSFVSLVGVKFLQIGSEFLWQINPTTTTAYSTRRCPGTRLIPYYPPLLVKGWAKYRLMDAESGMLFSGNLQLTDCSAWGTDFWINKESEDNNVIYVYTSNSKCLCVDNGKIAFCDPPCTSENNKFIVHPRAFGIYQLSGNGSYFSFDGAIAIVFGFIDGTPPTFPSNACFPGASLVTMADHTTKRMEDIQVGDAVLTVDEKGEVAVESVLRLAHARNSQVASFVNVAFSYENRSGELSLTSHHLLYKCTQRDTIAVPEWFPIPANQLKIDDHVCVTGPDRVHVARVTGLGSSVQTGVYSAFTSSGRLVVDSVLCSGFSYTPQTWTDMWYRGWNNRDYYEYWVVSWLQRVAQSFGTHVPLVRTFLSFWYSTDRFP